MNECRQFKTFGASDGLTQAQRVGWNNQTDNNWKFHLTPKASSGILFYMSCESTQNTCFGRDCYDIHSCDGSGNNCMNK